MPNVNAPKDMNLKTLCHILNVLSHFSILCVRYYKVTDPGNWITVVESTGELRTANTIDRESPLVHQDQYNITIRAVDDSESGQSHT